MAIRAPDGAKNDKYEVCAGGIFALMFYLFSVLRLQYLIFYLFSVLNLRLQYLLPMKFCT